MSQKQKKAIPASKSMGSAVQALQALCPRTLRFRMDAVMDEIRCSACKHLYGYAPYRPEPGAEQRRPRLRNGGIKWCPKCEGPCAVRLQPMLWRGIPITPYRYPDMTAALELATKLGIGLPVKEEPDTRSVAERLRAIGMEVA